MGVWLNDRRTIFKWLKDQPLADRLLYIRYKYHFETKWTYSNEILVADIETNPANYYVYLNDWYEGQENIEILGCQTIDSIDVNNMWN